MTSRTMTSIASEPLATVSSASTPEAASRTLTPALRSQTETTERTDASSSTTSAVPCEGAPPSCPVGRSATRAHRQPLQRRHELEGLERGQAVDVDRAERLD